MIGEWIQQADVWILLLIQEYLRADWMTGFWKAVTFLGNAGWFWIVTAVVFALIPKTRRAGLTAGFSLAVGALITNVFLKNAVARIRPYDLYPVIELLVEKQTDFPSLQAIPARPLQQPLSICGCFRSGRGGAL